MSDDKYPGWQRMITHATPSELAVRHVQNLAMFECPAEECEVRNVFPHPDYSLEFKQGYHCSFELHWTTYRGWRVYLWHTGCLAAG